MNKDDKRINNELSLEFRDMERDSFSERLMRVKFIQGKIGEEEYHAYPVLAINYLEEAKICLVYGSFAACIIISQLICEEMLKWPFRAKGDKSKVESNMSELIEHSLENKLITSQEARKLDALRLLRNRIVHSKDYSHGSKMKLKYDLMMSSYPWNIPYLERKAKFAFSVAWEMTSRHRLFG